MNVKTKIIFGPSLSCLQMIEHQCPYCHKVIVTPIPSYWKDFQSEAEMWRQMYNELVQRMIDHDSERLKDSNS